jgi:oligoribonuclease
MEMTGLDVARNVPIEIAAVITDYEFRTLDSYHAVIRQPQHYLDAMDAWNKEQHKKSGLMEKVSQGREPQEVEKELLRLVDRHFPRIDPKSINPKDPKAGWPILAGNSIMQDRLFIDKYFPEFAARLHYRMLDVSSWKIVFQNRFKKKYEKTNLHRASGDIEESISELRYYLGFVKIS